VRTILDKIWYTTFIVTQMMEQTAHVNVMQKHRYREQLFKGKQLFKTKHNVMFETIIFSKIHFCLYFFAEN
jgi:hypothetical protein